MSSGYEVRVDEAENHLGRILTEIYVKYRFLVTSRRIIKPRALERSLGRIRVAEPIRLLQMLYSTNE